MGQLNTLEKRLKELNHRQVLQVVIDCYTIQSTLYDLAKDREFTEEEKLALSKLRESAILLDEVESLLKSSQD